MPQRFRLADALERVAHGVVDGAAVRATKDRAAGYFTADAGQRGVADIKAGRFDSY